MASSIPSETSTPETTTSTTEQRARLGAIAVFLANSMFLVAYHITTTTPSLDAPTNERDFTYIILPIQSSSDKILFGVLILTAFELLDFLTKKSGQWLNSPKIPVRGKHLDNLRAIDIFCIGFSKANTGPFTYFYLRYCWNSLPWQLNEISFRNALLPLPLIFLLFDATYAATHYVLHWQCLYPYIHKHHHVQKAPSRANVDAVNVHPVEFILGEYNHWFVIHVWTTVARQPLHAFTAFAFLVIGGILAGINHTRYDIVVSFPVPQKCVLAWYRSRTAGTFASSATPTKANGVNQENWIWIPIYDSKAHDVHHRIPQSNYGQYTMFWDYIFGSYRAYNPNDRINVDSQLDPYTGKTIAIGKAQ